MTKISFNPKALSGPVYTDDSRIGRPKISSAFQPVVLDDAGVEAIRKALSLANIEGFVSPQPKRRRPAKDVDR